MTEPDFSVVVPSFGRLDALPEVLAGLQAQQGAPRFEVIVVDDGSEDGTREWLAGTTFDLPLRVILQQHLGPAAARNRGVAEARGRWVAFLGDDTIPAPEWLAAHAAAHQRWDEDEKTAVLGRTRWHRGVRLTPFLRYINEYGLQFGYSLIEDADRVPFNFYYTSNLSLARRQLLEETFDLRFPYPAWEDTELGYRLEQRGVRLAYCEGAVTYHLHPTSLRRFCERQEKAGYAATVFYRIHPELGAFLGIGEGGPPALPSRLGYWSARLLSRLLERGPARAPRLWERVLRYHYILGLRRGWRETGPERTSIRA